MPEWVYGLGWLAVPVAAVALSAWWHERQHHISIDEWLVELQARHHDALVSNQQLRQELGRVDREYNNLRHAMVGWPAYAGDGHEMVQPAHE